MYDDILVDICKAYESWIEGIIARVIVFSFVGMEVEQMSSSRSTSTTSAVVETLCPSPLF
jgi:hypothetical protein